MKTLVLIDSNAVVHRAYHALPKNLSNSKGELTNVTYGFALAIIKILEELNPDYIVAAFDLAGPTFRHLEYKEYKATRVKADQELYDQIPRVKEMLEAFGIPIYAEPGFEADDILGTIVEEIKRLNLKIQNDNEKCKIYIASGDRDVYQLLNGHVCVLMLRKGFSEAEIFDTHHLKEVYNLDPEDFIDLKALMGDASDNIPGIPGIGPKTATDLLLRFDTLQHLYDVLETQVSNIKSSSHSDPPTMNQNGSWPAGGEESQQSRDQRDPSFASLLQDDDMIKALAKKLEIKERILKLLIEHKDQAFQSKMLATIRRDVPIEFDLEKARWGQYDKERVRALFEELEFKSLLRRFSKDYQDSPTSLQDESGLRRAGEVSPEGQKPKADPTSQKLRGAQTVTEEQKKKDEQLRLEI